MQSQITLTLNASCLLHAPKRGGTPVALMDIPEFVSQEFGLRGIQLPVELVRGRTLREMEELRHNADKAGCPLLVLSQDDPVDLGASTDGRDGVARLAALGSAARHLGCGHVAVRTVASSESADAVISCAKRAIEMLRKNDVGLLLRSGKATMPDPASLADIIRRIGGFHIGAMPSFADSHASGDLAGAIRLLAPYSHLVEATIIGFGKSGHEKWDLQEAVEALRGVGYMSLLSIDWRGAKGDWVAMVHRAKSELLAAIGREEQVA
ncbi:MAG: hypothetical protein FGM37_11365 [Phycisphaerales bacterium]|nr:hypothetical protein [Phycisphaerales bacterium]